MIFRFEKNAQNPYSMIHRGIGEDPALSAKAKGIMLYLLGKPDAWRAHERDLIHKFTDGRDSIRAGIRELEARGYLKRRQLRTKEGQFTITTFDIYESPEISQNPEKAAKPRKITTKKPLTEKPLTDNPTHSNNRVIGDTDFIPKKIKKPNPKPKIETPNEPSTPGVIHVFNTLEKKPELVPMFLKITDIPLGSETTTNGTATKQQ